MDDLVINYEELILGAFVSALMSDHDSYLTNDEVLDYESNVIDYCFNNNIDTVIKSDEKDKAAFKNEHSEFLMLEDGIKLISSKEWNKFKMKVMNLKEEKTNALFNKNAVLVFSNKQKTLSK